MKTIAKQILDNYQNTSDLQTVIDGQEISKVSGKIDIYRFRDGSEIEYYKGNYHLVPDERDNLHKAIQSLNDTVIAMQIDEFEA